VGDAKYDPFLSTRNKCVFQFSKGMEQKKYIIFCGFVKCLEHKKA
jgi:hypothetical protein